jgi:type II secretory pathway component PulJ
MRKSIVLVEILFSIVLFSILLIGSMKMIYALYQKNNTQTSQTHNNIKLESTRLFLIKQNNLSSLTYTNNKLYFDTNLLLDNISTFDIATNNNYNTINICISKNTICQKWTIKNR